MRKITWEVPVKTVSEANNTDHWSKKAKRRRLQQQLVRISFGKYVDEINLPCTIKLTRQSPRKLDDDNLQMAFKGIRDELSECILPDRVTYYTDKKGKLKPLKGRADCDDRIKWVYEQVKSKDQGIEIELSFEESEES